MITSSDSFSTMTLVHITQFYQVMALSKVFIVPVVLVIPVESGFSCTLELIQIF